MKTLLTLILMSSAFASASAFAALQIETRIANDYSLFDDIKSFEIVEKTVTPTGPGSRIVIRVRGDVSSRDCAYQSHAVVLQPRSTLRAQDEVYLASLVPIYQQKQIPLSSVPCTDISMVPTAFETNLEFVSHTWDSTWPSRVYEVSFLGISGITIKKLSVELAPKTGWVVQLK